MTRTGHLAFPDTRLIGPAALIVLGLAGLAGAECDVHEQSKLAAADPSSVDLFGRSVALGDGLAACGAPNDDAAGQDAGAVHLFSLGGSDWMSLGRIVAPDPSPDARFGHAVAIAGDVMVVGAYRDNDLGPQSGSAYIFRRDGDTWVMEAKLLASDGGPNDWFGREVAIDDDGGLVVVGARLYDGAGTDSGAAYVFRHAGRAQWTQDAILSPDDLHAHDHFGSTISTSGGLIAVGAPEHDQAGPSAGAVYVYVNPGDGWTVADKIVAPDQQDYAEFGTSVCLRGTTLAVGTPYHDDRGLVWIMDWNGAAWSGVAGLFAPNATPGDEFGFAVSMHDDTLVVGAPQKTTSGGITGAAYIHRFDDGEWTFDATFMASDAGPGDGFGVSVSTRDGIVVTGSYHDDDGGSNAGSAYILRGARDCNGNDVMDLCDIMGGASSDENGNGAPDECDPLVGDFNGDGHVNAVDLARLLATWGTANAATDLDGSGIVGLDDLQILLANWG